MEKIKISSIVAMAENRVIGRDNSLIWHIPEDLKHFKNTTMGKPMIMGRKSFESLPGMLPGRAHIVISRHAPEAEENTASSSEETTADTPPLPDLNYVKSIEKGIERGREIAAAKGLDEIFITGGGEIYRQTMPLIDRLYLTIVHKAYEGDTYFPEINWDDWKISHEDHRAGDPSFTLFTLDRK